jgi:hypothetical protein
MGRIIEGRRLVKMPLFKNLFGAGKIKIDPKTFAPKTTQLDYKAEILAREALLTKNPDMWMEAKAVKKIANAYRKLGQ